MLQIDELLHLALNKKASDLHLSAGTEPLLRIDGDLRKFNLPVLNDKILREFCYNIMTPVQKKTFANDLQVDFALQTNQLARFRVNVFEQNRGIAAVFRSIPSKVPSLDDFEFPEILKEIAGYKNGLVLVTGATGSGKTTTMAAMIDYINHIKAAHILTLEDPIEIVHSNKKSLISQREVFRDTPNFSKALRAALREDPDIIFIGELRDLETMRLALTAAETGHLVFASLHTNSAPKTIDRLLDVFPSDEKMLIRNLLSESLKAVISQSLIKTIGEGRIACFEIMIVTEAIRHLIREAKVAQMISVIQTSRHMGMQTFDQHLQELILRRKIGQENLQNFNKALNVRNVTRNLQEESLNPC